MGGRGRRRRAAGEEGGGRGGGGAWRRREVGGRGGDRARVCGSVSPRAWRVEPYPVASYADGQARPTAAVGVAFFHVFFEKNCNFFRFFPKFFPFFPNIIL